MIPYSNEYVLQYMATLNNKDYISGLKGMEKGTNKTGGKIEGTFSKVGKSISSILTPQRLATAAFIGFTYQVSKSVKKMIAYEKALTKVNTLMKVGKSELNAYGFQFKNLSAKLGIDELNTLQGAYQALSAGVKKDNLMEFMEVASKGAIAGFTNTETSITSLTSVLNAYKLEMSQANKVMDIMLTIQAKGVTTLGELGSYMGEVTPMAAALDISLEDLGAAIAQITQNGNNTAKTMTMLKQMFAELSKEGQQANKNFNKISGKSFKEFIAEGNSLSDALNLMSKYAKKNDKSIIDMFGSIEAGSAALNLTGKNIDDFNEKIKDMKNSAGELEKAYSIASDNIASEWNKLLGSMENRWQKFIVNISSSAGAIIKSFRQAMDGTFESEFFSTGEIEKAKLEADDLKNKILQLSATKQEMIDNGEKGTDKYLKLSRQLKAEMKKLKEKNGFITGAIDYQNKTNPKINNENSKAPISSLDEKAIQAKQERLNKIRIKSEEQLKEDMLRIDKEMLANKSKQLSDLNSLYEKGNIDKKEYDARLKELDASNTLNQQIEYKKALESLKSFYEEKGNIIESNRLDKQILEIEVKIKGLEGQKIGAVDDSELQDFRSKQLEDEDNFRTEQLKREWEFLEKKGALKIQGKISDEQFENDKQAFKLSQSIAQEEFDIGQLEKQRDFYLQQEGMEQQAYDLQKKIIQKKEDLEKGAKKVQATKLKWENWAESKKVDIQAKSANAVLDTYSALAKGQIKSLEDFKKFAKMQLAELLLAKGQEHASLAISDTAKGISFAANPLTASLAPPEFMSAAKNAALAATWGVAAATLNSSDENEESNSNNEVTESKYDDGIEKRSELGKKESEGNVIIDVSDSQMAKIMIKQIEKELNDGYNVTLIGKKK